MGKGWRAATRSEYRKVEELTLASFFVITLLASTISGVEVPSLRRAPLRRPLAGSAKVVKRTKVRRRGDVGGEERRLNGKVDGPPRDVGAVVGRLIAFGPDGEKIADKAIARCFGAAIAFTSMKFNLIGHVLSLQEREILRVKASQALFYESRESTRDAGSLSFARHVRAKGVRTKSVKMDQVLHVSEYLRGIYDFAMQYFHASCDFRAPLSRASLTFVIPRDHSPEDIGTFALGRGRSRFKQRPTTHGDYSTFMQMSVAFSYKYLMRPTKIPYWPSYARVRELRRTIRATRRGRDGDKAGPGTEFTRDSG
ncbi:hypothetical protein G5I_03962 [Acromyrmex echinatior]|uniref:Uncharacterized protein n=1 Tax=Acromyrmex echinatior TaxID=103372 RepID=F4WEC9_ACREC|nr:hypothetical protein G5I_03962 [Acromyrmex echinatior]